MDLISGSKFTLDQLLTMGDNDAVIRKISEVPGKAVEGKVITETAKEIMRARNENAILRAAQELAKPVSDYATTAIPKSAPIPPAPKVDPLSPLKPGGVIGQALTKLNPILNFLSLMTYTGELNTGEDEWLRARDKLEKQPLGPDVISKPIPFRPMT